MKERDLSAGWELTHRPLSWEAGKSAELAEDGSDWLAADIPCDVHDPLVRAGLIPEPVEGLNCFASEWIEDRSWWFRKRFDAEPSLLSEDLVELVVNGLDADAQLFLNCTPLGRHVSVHYPFIADVKGILRERGNLLLVRVTAGAERWSRQDTAPFAASVTKTDRRGDERRVFLRKPQYVYGWDWGPRIATCGITGSVCLQSASGAAVRGVRADTLSASAAHAELRVTAEVWNLHIYRTREAVVSVKVSRGAVTVAEARSEVLLRSGTNEIPIEISIEKPALWWPNGMGDQPLYDVAVAVSSGDSADSWPVIRCGVRTLRLRLDKLGGSERLFAFEVNGILAYCKGADWVPADSIYARVTPEKYRTLIGEAREANFTMLRVWGGGIYEPDIFYDLCDESGILVWQDFMFACALYPDDREWFRREVEREAEHQVKRLGSHACLALWSGNNENHWGFDAWWIGDRKMEFPGGADLYNNLLPRVVAVCSPSIPYWNSSPYGGAEPNSSEVGDRHHWMDCTMNADMEKRITPEEYDKVSAKFVSEYGYIGPCSRRTIEQYHGGAPVERFSEVWNWHNNTFEKDTVAAGITKHYRDASKLTLEEYLLYAGLCQGLMYEYSLDAIRSKESCWGSLFWMYTDCWGEIGWTIIDYYCRRKPSFWYVKRAFSPVRLIARQNGDRVAVTGLNDSPHSRSIPVEYGHFPFDGGRPSASATTLELAPFSRRTVLEFIPGPGDDRRGVFAVRPKGGLDGVSAAVLRRHPFRELVVPEPRLEVGNIVRNGAQVSMTVRSRTYAHAIHFPDIEGMALSDNYFDLLPGEARTITASGVPEGTKAEDLAPRAVR